jgi:mono/diheme cytochrome c family protein
MARGERLTAGTTRSAHLRYNRIMRCAVLAAVATLCSAACSSGSDGMPGDAALERQALGMNDVSLLLPLPVPGGAPVLAGISGAGGTGDLVPRELFARLMLGSAPTSPFEDFEILAMRFDLCDRAAPGPCPSGLDGRIRLVFQPLQLPPDPAVDIGLHAFYAIPSADLAAVINELRGIARISGIPLSRPLGVRSLTEDAIARLRALIVRYARGDRLVRLTMMRREFGASDFRWTFHGLEQRGGEIVDITIPTLDAASQAITLDDSGPSYGATPIADSPAGFATALAAQAFALAAPAAQRAALDALIATQNPLLHTSTTVQCVACHTSTYLAVHRGAAAGIDPTELTSRFTTARAIDVSGGISQGEEHSLRGFGWFGGSPAISQRVANETAEVLDEIEQRFPPAPP